MNFKAVIDKAVRWLSTPLSGSKRRRDESIFNDHDNERKAQEARLGQTSVTGVDAAKSSQAIVEAAARLPPSFLQEVGSFHGQVPVETSNNPISFDVAGRVRELTPRRPALPDGTMEPRQGQTDHIQLQPQPTRQQENAKPALPGQRPPTSLTFSVGSGTAAGFRRPPQNPPRAQQQQQQQPQQPQPLHGPSLMFSGRTAAAPATQHGAQATPLPAPAFSGLPAHQGHRIGTPRQLFASPDSTRYQLDNLRLVASSTPVARPNANVGAAGAVPLQPGTANGRFNYYHGPSAGGAPNPAAGARGFTGFAAPMPLSYAMSYTQAQYQPLQLPQQQPQPQQHRLPFHMSFSSRLRELGTGIPLTEEELKAMVREYEARKFQRPAVAPLREDGGYIPGDEEEEEEGSKIATLANEACATVNRLRNAVAATMRTATRDPRVAAAATSSQAARTALEASQAAAGLDTISAVGLKVAAHEEAVKRYQAEMEGETRRKLEMLRTEQDARRAQLAEQHQRLRQGLVMLQPKPLAAAAAAAPPPVTAEAEAPARGRPPQPPVAGRGRAAPPRAKAAPPPKDEDVVDLLSSDEEEEEGDEEEEVAAAEEGEGEEEEDDRRDPYGVEYGAYPGEERGGGNPALKSASRKERSVWRRIMGPRAEPSEVVVDFRPNTVSVIELPRAKLQCLDVGVWLNDEVINMYMLLLQARDTRLRRAAASTPSPARPAAPRCHFFNSFFYNKLFQDEGTYNYANVRRWTTPKQLSNKLQESTGVLELDRIIMPIHKGVHWTCAEVDLRARAVRYYDSLMGEDPALMRHLLSWVSDESADKLKQRWDTSKWTVEFPKRIPEQHNGCDCGVFSIMFADRRGAGLPFDFSQRDMPLLRIQVLQRIVQMRVD